MTTNSQPKQKLNERREVIQLNGITILAVMVIIANFLIVGFINRYHAHELFRENRVHDREYTQLLAEQHDLHIEIAKLEHVVSWNDTAYEKAQRVPS